MWLLLLGFARPCKGGGGLRLRQWCGAHHARPRSEALAFRGAGRWRAGGSDGGTCCCAWPRLCGLDSTLPSSMSVCCVWEAVIASCIGHRCSIRVS